ncbi:MAG: plasmid pRiA4b ORF-3 family protein [Armatimonadota bacterium]|nr:plasmid pRiA4b ORF-3 family protein [Armatimonadota bacterium]
MADGIDGRQIKMANISDIYQLKVSLNHIKPPIWRRFLVRSDVKLTALHKILQIVMGWDNYHLYTFEAGRTKFADRELWEEDWYDTDLVDARKTKLEDVLTSKGSKLNYTYDLGDGWEHTITLVKILAPEPGERYPVCMAGERSCPPEDCGGIWGYEHLLEVLSNPDDEEYDFLHEWVGPYFDPETFDLKLVNTELPRRAMVKKS